MGAAVMNFIKGKEIFPHVSFVRRAKLGREQTDKAGV
jgi:hypothetical protein